MDCGCQSACQTKAVPDSTTYLWQISETKTGQTICGNYEVSLDSAIITVIIYDGWKHDFSTVFACWSCVQHKHATLVRPVWFACLYVSN